MAMTCGSIPSAYLPGLVLPLTAGLPLGKLLYLSDFSHLQTENIEDSGRLNYHSFNDSPEPTSMIRPRRSIS